MPGNWYRVGSINKELVERPPAILRQRKVEYINCNPFAKIRVIKIEKEFKGRHFKVLNGGYIAGRLDYIILIPSPFLYEKIANLCIRYKIGVPTRINPYDNYNIIITSETLDPVKFVKLLHHIDELSPPAEFSSSLIFELLAIMPYKFSPIYDYSAKDFALFEQIIDMRVLSQYSAPVMNIEGSSYLDHFHHTIPDKKPILAHINPNNIETEDLEAFCEFIKTSLEDLHFNVLKLCDISTEKDEVQKLWIQWMSLNMNTSKEKLVTLLAKDESDLEEFEKNNLLSKFQFIMINIENLIKASLRGGANPNYHNSNGTSLFYQISKYCSANLFEMLLHYFADYRSIMVTGHFVGNVNDLLMEARNRGEEIRIWEVFDRKRPQQLSEKLKLIELAESKLTRQIRDPALPKISDPPKVSWDDNSNSFTTTFNFSNGDFISTQILLAKDILTDNDLIFSELNRIFKTGFYLAKRTKKEEKELQEILEVELKGDITFLEIIRGGKVHSSGSEKIVGFNLFQILHTPSITNKDDKNITFTCHQIYSVIEPRSIFAPAMMRLLFHRPSAMLQQLFPSKIIGIFCSAINPRVHRWIAALLYGPKYFTPHIHAHHKFCVEEIYDDEPWIQDKHVSYILEKVNIHYTPSTQEFDDRLFNIFLGLPERNAPLVDSASKEKKFEAPKHLEARALPIFLLANSQTINNTQQAAEEIGMDNYRHTQQAAHCFKHLFGKFFDLPPEMPKPECCIYLNPGIFWVARNSPHSKHPIANLKEHAPRKLIESKITSPNANEAEKAFKRIDQIIGHFNQSFFKIQKTTIRRLDAKASSSSTNTTQIALKSSNTATIKNLWNV